MTPKELNRDIKRLKNYIKGISDASRINGNAAAFFKDLNEHARPEYLRLLNADRKFEYMNLESVKTMIRLNLAYRFVPFHDFGIDIEI